ncbi:GNAT family N-acetyltransferase [Candidatus Sumerlaeota bacterium]|nr:GNAT family N-acetyltransferase [Candidatus Sumerlaeota bacterium]
MENAEPSNDWQVRYADKIATAEKAVKRIRTGHRVYIGSGAGEPQTLVAALSKREDLSDTEIIHYLTLGVATYAEPRLGSQFRPNAFFIGPNVREAVSQGRADYTPIFLSEIPRLFSSRRIMLDVALIQVSPPDSNGLCSFGVSCDINMSATESAQLVIAEANAQSPRSLGNCFIHVDDIDVLVPSDTPILEAPPQPCDEISQRIGYHIANLVEDGATLQLGIGTVPDAVLANLKGFKNLGIHSEMISDGALPLFKEGVINNSQKTLNRGKCVISFVMGSRKLYDYIHNNPMIEFHPTEYVNDPFIISQHEKMISINSAIEVDLTGQVCSDSLGAMFYSGIGGQVDFVRGASRSKGGKPIIALPSTAEHDSTSRIVPHLKQGAGVVTSRGDVHYIVTEYGSAYLHGRTIRERAMSLIEIAHPRFRPWLMAEAKARGLVYQDQIEIEFRMPTYPDELEQWLKLRDESKVFMRPLKISDEPYVREFFYKLTPKSIHYRFFQMITAMPHAKLQEFLKIDYENDMAFLVLTGKIDEGGEVIAIAHYHKDPRTNFAEAAFLVRDDWQHKGIGTELIQKLAQWAIKNGIAGFSADVISDNVGMMRIFHRCGYHVDSSLEGGVYELHIPFDRKIPKEKNPPNPEPEAIKNQGDN